MRRRRNIDGQVPDFLYRLNLSLAAHDGLAWSPIAFDTITGKTVDGWWADYAQADCCAGATHTCCR